MSAGAHASLIRSRPSPISKQKVTHVTEAASRLACMPVTCRRLGTSRADSGKVTSLSPHLLVLLSRKLLSPQNSDKMRIYDRVKLTSIFDYNQWLPSGMIGDYLRVNKNKESGVADIIKLIFFLHLDKILSTKMFYYGSISNHLCRPQHWTELEIKIDCWIRIYFDRDSKFNAD